jgi:DNA-binding CsgD family transcriptional regulator
VEPLQDPLGRWAGFVVERARGSGDPFPVLDIQHLLGETYGAPVRWTTGGPEARGCRLPVSSLRDAGRGTTQELVIPVRVRGTGRGAFVVSRGDRTHGQDDLLLAHQVQALLVLLDRLNGEAARAGDPADMTTRLTARQRAVLALLCQGLTQDAIGRRLGCSTRTVEKHLEQIYRTLGVHDRLAAIRCAEDGSPE